MGRRSSVRVLICVAQRRIIIGRRAGQAVGRRAVRAALRSDLVWLILWRLGGVSFAVFLCHSPVPLLSLVHGPLELGLVHL